MEEGDWIWPKEGPVQFYSKALTLIWVGFLGVHFDVGKMGGGGITPLSKIARIMFIIMLETSNLAQKVHSHM